VFKVKKTLEQNIYAIKRIYFAVTTETHFEQHRVFEEVKSLSLLNHPNVIRYHSCWMEELELETMIKLNMMRAGPAKPLSDYNR
jgi:translation initiation factor 2-alpha kinase 1